MRSWTKRDVYKVEKEKEVYVGNWKEFGLVNVRGTGEMVIHDFHRPTTEYGRKAASPRVQKKFQRARRWKQV